MKPWQRVGLAVPAMVLCVAATQYAMRGFHQPTGSAGYLGTELAGVEAIRGNAPQALLATSANSSASLASANRGVFGVGNDAGVAGNSGTYGVHGFSENIGVKGDGFGESGVGVSGSSYSGFALSGNTTNGTAVYGEILNSGAGHAGYFLGRVHVNGTLTKSAGSFKIDHPLDPTHKYLSHSFVESPDMKNIYDGVVALEADGSATVELPEWFSALNKDFRYQLTAIGEHAPLFIAQEVTDNRFRIAGGYAGMKVSWQVTGIRNDAYAQAYRIPVEEVKPGKELGTLMHPQLYRPAAQAR